MGIDIKGVGSIDLQEKKLSIIPDLEELLSLPGSEIPLALSMMAREIDDTLRQMIVIEPERHGSLWERAKQALYFKTRCLCLAKTVLPEGKICGQCLQIGLSKLRDYHKVVLGTIEVAEDLMMQKQVEVWTQEYVKKIPPSLIIAFEKAFKLIVLLELGLRTKVWGRELSEEGFTEHSWQSTIPVAIPEEALRLVRDKILPRQDRIPFFTHLKVMTKGDDPFVVMVCRYGVIKVLLAFYEWGER